MSSIGTGYDLSASQFSPDGRVFQVEYAAKAVENSGTVIGLKTKGCVVLAVEKLVSSKLYKPTSNKKIFNIDKHIGMAVAGLVSDARQIVEVARTEAANYQAQYGVPIPLKHLAHQVGSYLHAYTLYSAVRPYGCSVLLCSYNKFDESGLYLIEPSGRRHDYYGCAVGKAKQQATTEIEKLNLDKINITKEELLKNAAKIIYQVHDELKDKNFELELAWIGSDNNGKIEKITAEERDRIVKEVKSQLEVDSDEEEAGPST